MSSRLDTPYLDAAPSHYKKARDNLYFTADDMGGDYRGVPRPLTFNSRQSRSSEDEGNYSYDRDRDVWVDSRIFQSDYRNERGNQSGVRNGRNNQSGHRTNSRDNRRSQSNRRNHTRTNQSNQRNENRTNQSNQGNNSGIDQSLNNTNRRPAGPQVNSVSRDMNLTSDGRSSARTIAQASHNAPRPTSNTRARSLSESAHPHSRPRPRDVRSLPHQSHSLGDNSGPVVVKQPLPRTRLATTSGANLPTPSRTNPLTPSGVNLPTTSGVNLPTPSGDSFPTPRRENLPTTSKEHNRSQRGEKQPKPSETRSVNTRHVPTPPGDYLPLHGGDILATPVGNNVPAHRNEDLPTNNRNSKHSRSGENKPTSSENRSNTGTPTDGIDANMNRTRNRNVKPPAICIDNQHIVADVETYKPPVSPRIRQLRQELVTTRNPLLGECPRPHSLDTEPHTKCTVKRTISAPELRHINSEETCAGTTRICVDNNRELRVEHEPRSITRGSKKAKGNRSRSLPIVSVPRRTSKRHHNTDADPLRYFAYLGKRFQFRDRLPSTHNVFSAGPVILTSTSVISPQVSNNFRNQYQEMDPDDVTSSKYQGACQDFIDCCTCMCCVKAMFYHCTKDDDSEGDVSEHPCACSKPEPNCLMRWGILGMLTVCMPCLFFYLPIQGCKRAVEYLRRKEQPAFENL